MEKKQLAEILSATPDFDGAKHVEFGNYITMIGRKQKTSNGWETVDSPYMNVDGRLAMANADHRKQGKMLHIYPARVLVNDDRELTLQVEVSSEIYGKRSGVATSYRVGGSPIESQHPWEIAETSAIGRALASMGYGLLPGSGLASAEDMQRALADDEPRPKRSKASSLAPSANPNAPEETQAPALDYDGLRQYIIKQGWPGPQQSDFVDLVKARKWDRDTVKEMLAVYDEMSTKDYLAFASKLETDLKVAKGEA